MKAARYPLAGLVLLLGIAGLLRGNVESGDLSSPAPPARAMIVTNAGVIATTGSAAQVRLTLTNSTGRDDTLLGISGGAGASTDIGPNQIPIKDGATLTFGPTQTLSITIEQLFGPVSPGQTVMLSLDFAQAGSVLVEASVVTQ